MHSGFDGDDSCLAAPRSSEGFQMHFGPSDYDDPDAVAPFTLHPGEEVNECLFLPMPNQKDVVYSKIVGGMRPGSHHFIARAMEDEAPAQGLQDCAGADATGTSDSIGGSQYRRFEFPPPAPDYEGLAGKLPAGRQGMLNGHFINATENPTLAEAWLNYESADPAAVKGYYATVSLNGGIGMRIPAHSKQSLSYSCSPSQSVRLLQIAGHFHAHTTRFSAWKIDAEGHQTPIMESYHWEELATFSLDSVTRNAEPDPDARRDGAMSGPVTIAPGESIGWKCDIENTTDDVLKFRNEVQTGEMCLVVGIVAATDESEGETVPFTCSRN